MKGLFLYSIPLQPFKLSLKYLDFRFPLFGPLKASTDKMIGQDIYR